MRRGLAARLGVLVCVLTVVLLHAVPAFAELLTSTDPPFTMKVPDGFVSRADQNKNDQIATYHREGASRLRVGAIIGIDRMRGTLGRDGMKADDPQLAAKGFTLEHAKWKSFDVDVIRGTQTIADYPVVMFIAQVPLAPEAIQVKVLIDADEEADGRALLNEVLKGVDGRSNWLTERERVRSLITGLGKMFITLLIIVLIVRALVRKVRGGGSPAHEPPPRYQAPGAPGAMPTTPMSQGGSVKCANCGLIGFGGTTCRRCNSPV